MGPGGNSTYGEEKPRVTGCPMSLQRCPRSFLGLRSRGKVWEPAQSSAPPHGSGWPPLAPRPAAFSTYSCGFETRFWPASPSGAGTRPDLPSPSCSGSAWCRRWTPAGRPDSWKTRCASSSFDKASSRSPPHPLFFPTRPPGLFLSLALPCHFHPERCRRRRFPLWYLGRFFGHPGSTCPVSVIVPSDWPSQTLQKNIV